MGAGDDTFVWNPGDDNDTLEGQAGTRHDAVQRRQRQPRTSTSRPTAGACAFFRNIANVTMDLNDVEAIDFNALGGADTIVVNDLSGSERDPKRQPRSGGRGRAAATARPTTL